MILRSLLLLFFLSGFFLSGENNSIAPAGAEPAGEDCILKDQETGEVNFDYAGWRCLDILLPVIEGTVFEVRLRWNRPAMQNLATVVWLAGGDGRKPHAEIDTGVTQAPDPRPIRDRLDQDNDIRSIEVQFRNPQTELPVAHFDAFGGYWAPPRSGYLKAAFAYDRVLQYLDSEPIDLIQGRWLTLAGGSNGATIIAFALAYLDADLYADRIVFVSGPFLVDILRECGDPSFSAYTGINDRTWNRGREQVAGKTIRALLSAWNGWPDCSDPNLDAGRRSTLGLFAERNFRNTDIAVIMGAEDAFGPWILQSNAFWFDSISARSKTRLLIPAVGHDVFGADAPLSNAAPDNTVYEALRKPPAIPPGLFTIDAYAIYYSNGRRYCYFPNMAVYQQLTGKTDIDGVADYQIIPQTMTYAGFCEGG